MALRPLRADRHGRDPDLQRDLRPVRPHVATRRTGGGPPDHPFERDRRRVPARHLRDRATRRLPGRAPRSARDRTDPGDPRHESDPLPIADLRMAARLQGQRAQGRHRGKPGRSGFCRARDDPPPRRGADPRRRLRRRCFGPRDVAHRGAHRGRYPGHSERGESLHAPGGPSRDPRRVAGADRRRAPHHRSRWHHDEGAAHDARRRDRPHRHVQHPARPRAQHRGPPRPHPGGN